MITFWLSRIWLPLTTLQLHITHGLQLPSFTALRHTHFHPPLHQLHRCHWSTLIVLPHLHLIHSPTYKQHTSLHTWRSLVLARLTFLSVIHPAICYLCVWPWTAWPWNSEPVLVTSTPAWYCLRLCSASDFRVVARWPLPVWFCLCLINLTASGSTRLRPVITLTITVWLKTK